jgi:hypothetical protein
MPRRARQNLLDDAEILRVLALLRAEGLDVARASSIDIRTDGLTLTVPQAAPGEGSAYDQWKNVDTNRAPPAHN